MSSIVNSSIIRIVFKELIFVCRDGSIRKIKFTENIHIFRCPICKTNMYIYDSKDIACLEGHCFNIARKGYVNFLLKSIDTDYDREMFYSRNIVYKNGFFTPMLEDISGLIVEKLGSGLDGANILDAGCGEGSHMGHIIDSLKSSTDSILKGVGVDISKEGILLASKNYFDIIWCVADLANLPFMDSQFDVILNILSPANYEEFNRTLKDDGILIKVIPGNSYLKELRDIFYDGTEKEVYSNDEVIEHCSKNFKILDIREVSYDKKIGEEELVYLINMTPLSWTVTDAKIAQAFKAKIDNISANFTIIVGERA